VIGAAVLVVASLAASPAHVTLTGSARQAIEVTNSGATPVVVEARVAGFTLDLRGQPRIVPVHRGLMPVSWLTLVRPRIVVPARGWASVNVVSTVPPSASPGEHNAVVVLSTVSQRSQAVAVQMRLGIQVSVQVPGAIVHRLDLEGLAPGPGAVSRVLDLALANRGNVTELLERRRVDVLLRRAGKLVARLHPAARELLPRSRGIAEVRYPSRLRGWVRAVVELKSPAPGRRVLRRTFRVRL
jgi:hypothetical protein